MDTLGHAGAWGDAPGDGGLTVPNDKVDVDPKALWKRINQQREVKWAVLVDESGVSGKTLQRWSWGRNKPSRESVEAVAKALGTTIEALTAGLPRASAHGETSPVPSEAPSSPELLVPDSIKVAPQHPYHPWKPAPPGDLFGRGSAMACLEEAIADGRSVSVVGDRRVGKSSVLQAWRARVRALGYDAISVSGENVAGLSADTLVEAITGVRTEADADAAADALLRWLKGQQRTTPLVVIIDEFDDLARQLQPRFFQRLGGLVGEGRAVFVLATGRDLCALSQHRHISPFDNRLETIHLGLLEPEAAERLIGLKVDLLGSDGPNLLRRWAGRHPFYLKLLAYYLVKAHRDGRPSIWAIQQFRPAADPHLRNLWQQLSTSEQAVLCGRDVPIRWAPPPSSAPSPPTPSPSAVMLPQPEQGAPSVPSLPSDSASKALLSLQRRGLVTEDESLFGEVLMRWLNELTI